MWIEWVTWVLILISAALQMWCAHRFYKRQLWVEMMWTGCEALYYVIFYGMGSPEGWWSTVDTYLFLLTMAVSLTQLLDQPPERVRSLTLCFWAMIAGMTAGEPRAGSATFWTMCATQLSYACILGFRYSRGVARWQLILCSVADVLAGLLQFHGLPLSISQELADLCIAGALVINTWPIDYQIRRSVYVTEPERLSSHSICTDEQRTPLDHPHPHLERRSLWTLFHMIACNMPTNTNAFIEERRKFLDLIEVLHSIYPQQRPYLVMNPNPISSAYDKDSCMRATWEWHNADRKQRQKPPFPWSSYSSRWVCPPMCRKRAQDLSVTAFQGVTLPVCAINPLELISPASLRCLLDDHTTAHSLTLAKTRLLAPYRPLCELRLASSAVTPIELLVYLCSRRTYVHPWLEKTLVQLRQTSSDHDRIVAYLRAALSVFISARSDIQYTAALSDLTNTFMTLPENMQELLFLECRIHVAHYYDQITIDDVRKISLQDMMSLFRARALEMYAARQKQHFDEEKIPTSTLLSVCTYIAATTLLKTGHFHYVPPSRDEEDEDEKKQADARAELWSKTMLEQLQRADVLQQMRQLGASHRLGRYLPDMQFVSNFLSQASVLEPLFQIDNHREALEMACHMLRRIEDIEHKDSQTIWQALSYLDSWAFTQFRGDALLFCHFQESGHTIALWPALANIRKQMRQLNFQAPRVTRAPSRRTLVQTPGSTSHHQCLDFWHHEDAANYLMTLVLSLRIVAGTQNLENIPEITTELTRTLGAEGLDFWILQKTDESIKKRVVSMDTTVTFIREELRLAAGIVVHQQNTVEWNTRVIEMIGQAILARNKGPLVLEQTLDTLANDLGLWTSDMEDMLRYCMLLIGTRLNLVDIGTGLNLPYSISFRHFMTLVPLLQSTIQIRQQLMQVLLVAVIDHPHFDVSTQPYHAGAIFLHRLPLPLRSFVRSVLEGVSETDILFRTARSLGLPYFLPQVTLTQIQQATISIPERPTWTRALEKVAACQKNAISELILLIREQRREFFLTHMSELVDKDLLPQTYTDAEYSKQRWAAWLPEIAETKTTPVVTITANPSHLVPDVAIEMTAVADTDAAAPADLRAAFALRDRDSQQLEESDRLPLLASDAPAS